MKGIRRITLEPYYKFRQYLAMNVDDAPAASPPRVNKSPNCVRNQSSASSARARRVEEPRYSPKHPDTDDRASQPSIR
jgi:hypothetical protein